MKDTGLNFHFTCEKALYKQQCSSCHLWKIPRNE